MSGQASRPWAHAAAAGHRYGWVLVGVGALSMAYQAGLVGGRTVFVATIPEESGWTRAATSAAVSALALGSGLWAPLIGYAVQRWGARHTMSISGLVVGVGLVMAGMARDPLELGLALLLLVAPGSMGVGTLANFAAIQAWFVARRGMALALADSGSSLGMMLLVPLTQLLIGLYGWRGAYLVLGLAGLLLVPFHWLLQRPPPEPSAAAGGSPARTETSRHQAGLGHASGSHGAAQASAAAAGGVPERAAIWALVRSRRFALLVTGLACVWIAQQIVTVHQAAYLADHGYDALSQATTFALIGLTGLPGRPAFGWLADRLGTTPTFGLLTLGLVGGIGALIAAGEARIAEALALYGVALGMSLGVGTLLYARQVSTLFGQQRFGTIMGLGYFFGSAAGAGAATLAGFARDVTGTYVTSFGVAALAAVLSFGCVWLLERASRPTPSP